MLLEQSITLLENIYSGGVTHYNSHMISKYFYSTGHSFVTLSEASAHNLLFSQQLDAISTLHEKQVSHLTCFFQFLIGTQFIEL
jgi:hypothetical protein